jgi:hypothetical protein
MNFKNFMFLNKSSQSFFICVNLFNLRYLRAFSNQQINKKQINKKTNQQSNN